MNILPASTHHKSGFATLIVFLCILLILALIQRNASNLSRFKTELKLQDQRQRIVWKSYGAESEKDMPPDESLQGDQTEGDGAETESEIETEDLSGMESGDVPQ
ncbi:MAG: hypothetical protein LR011_13580 [Verrucomicrobia bacterium]|nr:hypothetical protein [Verrucomicrobiota bacterium]